MFDLWANFLWSKCILLDLSTMISCIKIVFIFSLYSFVPCKTKSMKRPRYECWLWTISSGLIISEFFKNINRFFVDCFTIYRFCVLINISLQSLWELKNWQCSGNWSVRHLRQTCQFLFDAINERSSYMCSNKLKIK